jgi:hypothetical protein
VAEFIAAIPKMECVSLRSDNATLALDDPERFRPQLLKVIAEHIKQSKLAMGPTREVEIAGLERPVVAMQKGARELTLFIHYSLRIRQ